jgi:hypothetical protein
LELGCYDYRCKFHSRREACKGHSVKQDEFVCAEEKDKTKNVIIVLTFRCWSLLLSEVVQERKTETNLHTKVDA